MEVANCQNKFFVDKVSKIRESMPAPLSDPLAKLRALMFNRSCYFSLQAVHPDEVAKLIKELKNSKSVGLDSIDTGVIKLIQAEIVPALTHVVNLSISTR